MTLRETNPPPHKKNKIIYSVIIFGINVTFVSNRDDTTHRDQSLFVYEQRVIAID